MYLIYLPFKKHLLKSGKLTSSLNQKINRTYILLLLTIVCYSTYTAFYPPDSFYKEEFKYNTDVELPQSAEIIDKDSDYPDFHGDFAASAIIKLNEVDYAKLKTEIAELKNYEVDETREIGITQECRSLIKNISDSDMDIVLKKIDGVWFKVAFLKDKKTIIFERSSS